MSRVIAAFSQFLNGEGEPLANGWLEFLYTDTNNTLKNTYSDEELSVPNENPVQLDGEGRCPNVFGLGQYKVMLYDNNPVTWLPGTMISMFDPVNAESTSTSSGTNFEDWNVTTEYSVLDIVSYNSFYYRSLDNANLGNAPDTNLDKWEKIDFLRYWNINVTYATNDVVISGNSLYFSLADANVGNTPVSSPTWWTPVGSGTVLSNWEESGTTFQPVTAGYDIGAIGNEVGHLYTQDATFTNFPLGPSAAPTADYELANKKYVDDNAGGLVNWEESGTTFQPTAGGYDLGTARFNEIGDVFLEAGSLIDWGQATAFMGFDPSNPAEFTIENALVNGAMLFRNSDPTSLAGWFGWESKGSYVMVLDEDGLYPAGSAKDLGRNLPGGRWDTFRCVDIDFTGTITGTIPGLFSVWEENGTTLRPNVVGAHIGDTTYLIGDITLARSDLIFYYSSTQLALIGHDGTHMYIRQEFSTGDLDIGLFHATATGTIDFYIKNNRKWRIDNDGILVPPHAEYDIGYTTARIGTLYATSIDFDGASIAAGTLRFNDGILLYFGTDSDMNIQHTGAYGHIDCNEGGLYIDSEAAHEIAFREGSTVMAKLEPSSTLATGETSLWIWDDDASGLVQVTVGADDSGGTGYKVLRIPN